MSTRPVEVRPKLLTTSEAARALNVHENTLRRWCDRGIVSSYRIGKRADRRFSSEDIQVLKIHLSRHGGDVRSVQSGTAV